MRKEKKNPPKPSLLAPVHYLELVGLPPLYVQKQGNEIWIHVEGQTLCFAISSLKVLGLQGEILEGVEEEEEANLLGGDSPYLVAPLPGKITKVFVREGDCVEKEKSLLLMEAMKMQYNLKAHLKGKVKKICIKEGQQVELGKKLMVLEPLFENKKSGKNKDEKAKKANSKTKTQAKTKRKNKLKVKFV